MRGCNMSFKRHVLDRVGGFDTRYVGNAYREESDICMRVRRAGFAVRFAPAAKLVHLEAPAGGCREVAPLHDGPVVYRNEFPLLLNFPLARFPVPVCLAGSPTCHFAARTASKGSAPARPGARRGPPLGVGRTPTVWRRTVGTEGASIGGRGI